MFLAYQRASRPYKRLVFDDFTFYIFYIFFKVTIFIPSPPRSYRHLAGVMYLMGLRFVPRPMARGLPGLVSKRTTWHQKGGTVRCERRSLKVN